MEGFGEGGIPVKPVVVHLHISVASAGVHHQVGVESEVPRQFVSAVQTVGNVPDVGWLFAVCNITVDMTIREIALCVEGEILFLVTEIGLVVHKGGPHTTQFGIGAASSDGETGTFVVA